MRIVTLSGVFSPISDTWLLARAVRHETLPPGGRVLDACTGSGALAITAALRGVADVTAVDVSRRALLTVRLNARLNGVSVRARRSDLFDALGGERYDLIVSNPPYVPAASDDLPRRGPERAWDAGRDGRVLLDRLCAQAPAHLQPGGRLLLVHSSLLGFEATREALEAQGLEVDVAARERGPLGSLMSERRAQLEAAGLLAPGQREEEVLVVRAIRAAAASRPAVPGGSAAVG